MVDRYSPDFDENNQGPIMQDDLAGDYVAFDDYEELANEFQELMDKFDDLKDVLDRAQADANRIRR